LLFKYGKLALADALTGADGQTTPPKVRPPGPIAGPLPVGMTLAAAAAVPGDRTPDRVARDPSHRADHGRRRARRTRSEARARAASRLAIAAESGGVEASA
jgi:hypothetical protein